MPVPSQKVVEKKDSDWNVQRRFWLTAMLVMVTLGINKQLDLQSLLTDVGKALAKSEGWYAQRRTVQYGFVLSVVLFGTATVASGLWVFRRGGRWVYLGQVGLGILCLFVMIRAAFFYHLDAMLGGRPWIFNLDHTLELGGIFIVAIAAYGERWRA